MLPLKPIEELIELAQAQSSNKSSKVQILADVNEAF